MSRTMQMGLFQGRLNKREKNLARGNVLFLLSWILLFTLSCVQRPIEELTLADVALKAAQKAKSDVLVPDAYRKAENFYLRAKKDYSDGYYDSSRKYAIQARLAAEQAEFQALKKQNQIQAPVATGGETEGADSFNPGAPESGGETP